MKEECCKKDDCTREIFEEEKCKWEKKEGPTDPFDEKRKCCETGHGYGYGYGGERRHMNDRCHRKFEFIVRDIDIKDGKLFLDTCDCNDIDLCDGQPFEFFICPCIPRDGCRPRQVFIKVGCKVFPLTDRIGDYVFENQITNDKFYYGYYGADPEHVISYNVLRIPRW